MIGAIVLIDTSGEIIALKQYRKDFSMSALENYRISVISANDFSSPINLIDGTTFFHVNINDIFYVACVKQDADAARIFELLYKIPPIIEKTLNIPAINEKNARDYIIDIIEILDEMIDYGYPQQTEPETLKILTCHVRPELIEKLKTGVSIPTGSVPWRRVNEEHKEQNVYVDVVERVSLFITTDGSVLNKCINGLTSMNSSLNGMPECTIIFNTKAIVADRIAEQSIAPGSMCFDDITFHQCVKLSKFLSNKEISFIPPDGRFELMRYSKSEGVQAPFDISPSVQELGLNKLEIMIRVHATYDQSLKASRFRLVIPLPQNTANVEFQPAEKSEAMFDELKNAVVWKVDEFAGGTNSEIKIIAEYLSATYKTSSATKLNQPIHAEFQIPRLSASGFTLNNFRVNTESSPNLYIRYATEAGKFQIMMPSPCE